MKYRFIPDNSDSFSVVEIAAIFTTVAVIINGSKVQNEELKDKPRERN